jgi:thiol-disulfide isomerase/thioredoxin
MVDQSQGRLPLHDKPPTERRQRWPFGLLTLMLVAVVGIGILVFGNRSPSTTTTSIPLLGATVPTDGIAPNFAIDLLDGGTFILSDELAVGRPVILNLWASWCGPCREEMPELDAAARAHPEVSFIGVAVRDDPIAAEQFAAEVAVGYPLAIDETGFVAQSYPSPGLPATFFITPDGRIARILYGGLTKEKVDEAIAEVFGEA